MHSPHDWKQWQNPGFFPSYMVTELEFKQKEKVLLSNTGQSEPKDTFLQGAQSPPHRKSGSETVSLWSAVSQECSGGGNRPLA